MAKRRLKPKLPKEIRRVLSGLRWRIRAYVWLQGLSLALVWLAVTFWGSLAIDYLPVLVGASEMPRGARLVLLVFVGAVLAYILFQWVLRRTFVRLADRSMALLLERRFHEFHDSLITSVELTDGASRAQQQMLSETESEALQQLRGLRLGSLFNPRPLFFGLSAATLLCGSIAAFYAIHADAFELGLQRLYLLTDDRWPRNARIEVVGIETEGRPEEDLPSASRQFLDRRVKVARGSSISLHVRADGGAKVIPEVCTIVYRTAEGDRGRVNMTRVGAVRSGYQLYQYGGKPFGGLLSDVRFDVIGFDHRIQDYLVQAVDSPAIVAAELDCTYPAYLVDESLALWLPRTLELTTGMQLPRGTSVTIRAHSNKPLESVRLRDTNSKERIELTPGEDPQQFEYRVPVLNDNLSLEVILIDSDGVASERPHRIYLAAIEDTPPVIDIGLTGIGSAVTPDVAIPVEGKVTDDYLVDRSWAEVFVDDAAPQDLSFDRQPGGRIATTIDFRELRGSGQLTLEPGQKLHLTVKARDRYDLGDSSNVGVSDHFQRDVVKPDQLLAMLEARELSLRQRFQQVINELTETRDGLVRVRSEGPEAALLRAKRQQAPDEEPTDPSESLQQAWSLRLLRAQRARLQSQKSAQETLGTAASFLDIRAELINNRVDSEDRKERLKEKIADPLQQIGEQGFAEFDRRLKELVQITEDQLEQDATATSENSELVVATDRSLHQANQLLVQMDQVLQSMLDLESFNDLLDIVRSLIDDQKDLISETKKQQKKQVLDLLKSE